MGVQQIVKPIFLLSLPRSGSTLLQRVLATHTKVATAAEPWFLLPLVYATRKNGVVATYNHTVAVEAFEDFLYKMPGEQESYWLEVRRMALALYKNIGTETETHFLDKTPRYHLIIDELQQIFPEAKFVILWRNPLAIAASMMETWSDGKWNLHRFEIDLYNGLHNLANAVRFADKRFYTLKFEDFVVNPYEEYAHLLEFLELDLDTNGIHNFSNVIFDGRMGDPTGITRYKSIDSAANEIWPKSLSNPWRKYWARKYIDTIGADVLELMGYSSASLKSTLMSVPTDFRYLSSDISRIVYRKLLPTPDQKLAKGNAP